MTQRSLIELLDDIAACHYEREAGPLENNTAKLIAKYRGVCGGCKFDDRNVFTSAGCPHLWDITYNRRLRVYECAAREEEHE